MTGPTAVIPDWSRNPPVLVGAVPLFHVQSIVLTEGYKTAKLAGSWWVQMLAPDTKTIDIVAYLIGDQRLIYKKALEAQALLTPGLAGLAGAEAFAGIPVVSGLTVSTDMQITNLTFTHSIEKGREVIFVNLKLTQVPRTVLSALVGEAGDIALTAVSAAVPSSVVPDPLTRGA
ncbi:MAG TPA: hypothetical protein VIP98_11280 [Microlunatus sp.]